MHYVIHAYDHANALDRRMAARPAHIDYVGQLKAAGKFLLGGALLDPAGNMIGSMLILNLETEDELTTYLHTDPYIVQGVWDTIDIKPFRQANV
ncbi:YciI family protein [Spirosoma jeollabukense]